MPEESIINDFTIAGDKIVYATVVNILILSEKRQQIVLENFDANNLEHLFFLHAAMVARDVSHYKLYITGSWSLKHWIKKYSPSVTWTNKLEGNVNIPEVLKYERPMALDLLHNKSFSDIYKEFYERKEEKC